MYPEYRDPAGPDAGDFLKDLRGCVIGADARRASSAGRSATAFQLTSIIPPYQIGEPFEFIVRAIYKLDERRRQRAATGDVLPLQVSLRGDGPAGTASAPTTSQIANANQASAIAKAIDALFENSDAQTKTETEQAFLAASSSRPATSLFLLNFIGLAVAFTILLVTREHDEHGRARAPQGDRRAQDARASRAAS